MSAGQRVTANATLSGGTNNFTVSDFTTRDGTSLSSSDAVIVTGYIHGGAADFSRTGDPDTDSTFEINVTIESRSGAGERVDVHHIVTDAAGIEVNDQASGQEVTLYGVRLTASKVFVTQSAGVADTNEIARTTASRDTTETIYELVASSGDADLIRRHDPDDNGTFELAATVDTISAEVFREAMLPMKDEKSRTNAEMETALKASGGSRDLMILGTIGQE